jgi:hypothetical protein
MEEKNPPGTSVDGVMVVMVAAMSAGYTSVQVCEVSAAFVLMTILARSCRRRRV